MHFSYHTVFSKRKTIAIQIKPNGNIVVRAPKYLSPAQVDAFVSRKSAWIQKHLSSLSTTTVQKPFSETEVQQLCEQTKAILLPRVAQYASLLGINYNRVTIRRQHTRWGSCSSKGNLNFNCLLSLMPLNVMDYIIVHELCHRKHLNHSKQFWQEVARCFPSYKDCEQWLKTNGNALLNRLP